MEVKVFLSNESRLHHKSVFDRIVLVPDAFDINSFVSNMRAIYGEKCIVEVIFV